MIIYDIRKDSRKLILLTTLFGLLSTILMMTSTFVLNYVIDNIKYDIDTLIKDFNDKTIIMVFHDPIMAKYFNKKYVLTDKKMVVINKEETIYK